ncbi:hypothetical protein K443DRAFT_56982, partial [Laccaria amethystina LaAM-08-1]
SHQDLAFLGELQHGVYDDECEGLREEEINAFYGFAEDGESLVLDETPDQGSEDSDEYNDEEQNESGSEDNV